LQRKWQFPSCNKTTFTIDFRLLYKDGFSSKLQEINMRFFYLLVLISVWSTEAIFAVYDRVYEGLRPEWAQYEGDLGGRLNLIRSFLPEDPIVFEVGGKDGDDSVKLAKLWEKGTIISFEANPGQFQIYEERAKAHPNMFGYNLAVNTYNGTAKFYLCWGTGGTDPVFEGASSLLVASEAMKIHYMGPVIEVPCVIFDDWCKENSIKKVDFMWLDLEGFELQFLSSSPNILNTVSVIYAETNFFKFREGTTQFKDLKRFLTANGFTMVAHWYNEGLQGDAVFVRNTLVKSKNLLK
jgi:2-O-methyltransferase